MAALKWRPSAAARKSIHLQQLSSTAAQEQPSSAISKEQLILAALQKRPCSAISMEQLSSATLQEQPLHINLLWSGVGGRLAVVKGWW